MADIRTNKHWRFSSGISIISVTGVLCLLSLTHQAGAQPETHRLLPLGNSITEAQSGRCSYRCWLWKTITDSGYSVDFVGSRTGVFTSHPGNSTESSCLYADFDENHEGHWGWEIDDVLYGARETDGNYKSYGYGDSLSVWARVHMPDIVLLHLGTNDLARGHSMTSTVNELGFVIDTLCAANPDVDILLAKLIPSKDGTVNKRIDTLNSHIPLN